MASKVGREEILSQLRDKVQKRIPIIGGGAGTGISAKSEEAGGIDLIVIYNLRALSHGRTRILGGAAGLWQCQPNCQRDGS